MKFYILVIIFAFVVSCTITTPNDPVPPNRVMMIERVDGADTLDYMQGISTLPGLDNIRIMWEKPEINEDIKSFKVFRSTDNDGLINYMQYATVVVNNPGNPDTTFTDLHVDIGTHYHYFIRAVNNDGLESFPSDTVSLQLLDRATLNGPLNGSELVKPDKIEFQWHREESPSYFILRIEEYYTETFHPLVYVVKITNLYDPDKQYTLQQEIVEEILKDGRTYRWRIDSVNYPDSPVSNPLVKIYAESQSEYFTFKVNWKTK